MEAELVVTELSTWASSAQPGNAKAGNSQQVVVRVMFARLGQSCNGPFGFYKEGEGFGVNDPRLDGN